MRKLVLWLLTAPVGVVVVLFAVSNRGPVTLEMWPLPFKIDVPLFTVGLGGLFLGFLWGAVTSWYSSGGTRKKARDAARSARLAAMEADKVKAETERLKADAAQTTPATGDAADRAVFARPAAAGLKPSAGGAPALPQSGQIR